MKDNLYEIVSKRIEKERMLMDIIKIFKIETDKLKVEIAKLKNEERNCKNF